MAPVAAVRRSSRRADAQQHEPAPAAGDGRDAL